MSQEAPTIANPATPYRKVKLHDIAKRAGVSISTVSRVLNDGIGVRDEVRRSVLAVTKELDLEQKRQLNQGKVTHIGLFTDLTKPVTSGHPLDPFHTDILVGVEAECQRLGVHLSYSAAIRTPEAAAFVLDKVKDNSIDGLLLLSVDNPRLVETLVGCALPVALINAEHPRLEVDSYLPDNAIGPRIAVEHLLENGHRRILHITHRARATIRRRHEAYRATLEAAGIRYDPALVVDAPLSTEYAYRVVKPFLAAAPPDFSAVFCANDAVAIGMMRALQETGYHVPNDVSIVGYDDVSMAAFTSPPLTTIRIEREELGARAVRGLLERAANPQLTPARVELATRLVKRQSVADIRAR